MRKPFHLKTKGSRIILIAVILFGIVMGGCGSAPVAATEIAADAETAAEAVAEAGTAGEAVAEAETVAANEAVTAVDTAEEAVTEAGTVNEAVAEAASEKAAAQEEPEENASEAVTTTIGPDGTKRSNDSSDFVLLSDAVPDAILEIRYYSTYNFVGERIDGYEEPIALLTEEAADALREVSDELTEQGYRLKIYDAYRPTEAAENFVDWAKDTGDTRMKEYFYPELDKSVLFRQGYIGERSGHSRGSTVDLTLFDMSTEKEVDMGGTFDYFGEISHPDYRGITQEQYDNRMILREAMTAHGFKPLATEWWHFTLQNEPYPDTYFTFPVNSDSVER